MATRDEKAAKIKAQLPYFTGTSQYYYLPPFNRYNYTDGVKFVAKEAEAYWLLQHIFIFQPLPEIFNEEFQVWKIKVNPENSTAVITVDDGNGNIVKTFNIPFTDFPLDEFEMWFENNVLYLPSER